MPKYLAGEFLGRVHRRDARLGGLPQPLAADGGPGPQARGLLHRRRRSATPVANLLTEIIGTFVLVFVVLAFSGTGDAASPTAASRRCSSACWCSASASRSAARPGTRSTRRATSRRGSCTRILPIPGKGPSDWGYAWIPVVGPIIGGVLGALAWKLFCPGDPGAAEQHLTGGPRHRAPPIDLDDEERYMAKYVAAIDQGTTSTRCMIFDHGGKVVSVDQKEHEQIYPEAGLGRARREGDLGAHPGGRRRGAAVGRRERRATSPRVGITNQRETALVLGPDDRRAGATTPSSGRTPARTAWSTSSTPRRRPGPLPGARSGCRSRPTSPARRSAGSSTTSTAPASAPRRATCCSATWTPGCIWNLTGGTDGGLHITDVTNASRTMLMDLETLDWDDEHLRRDRRPAVDAAGDPVVQRGLRRGPRAAALQGVPIAGNLGDQQAATFGQTCFSPGEAKNTYGTGNFLLLNTGTEAVPSKNGLLTTVGYKIGDQAAVYCLEGSIAVTGSLVQWLRDNLEMIKAAPEVEELAATGRGQRRLLLRAGVLGPVRAVLAVQRARRRSPA